VLGVPGDTVLLNGTRTIEPSVSQATIEHGVGVQGIVTAQRPVTDAAAQYGKYRFNRRIGCSKHLHDSHAIA
jgi:hypothetical protein